MRKAIRSNVSDVRLLTAEQAQNYVGMGRTCCRQWCDEIGATRKFGGSVRFDKKVIDKVLDELADNAEAMRT